MRIWDSFEQKFPLLADSLKHARLSGRLGHSYLVVSANPELRNSFPLLLGAMAACRSPRPDGTPCEECRVCKGLFSGLYPDLFTLAPTSKSREILVGEDDDDPDTLRSFEAVFHLSSSALNGWKVGVIHECDTMNTQAQNAFLKTLEEPPKNCIFILTTGHPAALLPTIRSRCQILALTDNSCKYDMELFKNLPGILYRIQMESRNDISAADHCANELIDLMGSLNDAAAESVRKKWEARLNDTENLDSAGQKLIEKRMAGETGCAYRGLREQFLSIIHAWFAQTAFIASGIDRTSLPNPELVDQLIPPGSVPAVKEREALRHLAAAENLLKTLRSNVNDELAIRAFVLDICIK